MVRRERTIWHAFGGKTPRNVNSCNGSDLRSELFRAQRQAPRHIRFVRALDALRGGVLFRGRLHYQRHCADRRGPGAGALFPGRALVGILIRDGDLMAVVKKIEDRGREQGVREKNADEENGMT